MKKKLRPKEEFVREVVKMLERAMEFDNTEPTDTALKRGYRLLNEAKKRGYKVTGHIN